VAVCVGLFRGEFTESEPVTVLSHRAGLVMDPDAKVKLLGVEVGRVASIESRADGQAALHLAIDPTQLKLIPDNVVVNVAETLLCTTRNDAKVLETTCKNAKGIDGINAPSGWHVGNSRARTFPLFHTAHHLVGSRAHVSSRIRPSRASQPFGVPLSCGEAVGAAKPKLSRSLSRRLGRELRRLTVWL
jgi:hypothetical protein